MLRLPVTETAAAPGDSFAELSSKLAAKKTKLDLFGHPDKAPLAALKRFASVMRDLDPYVRLRNIAARSGAVAATNAWLKMHEMLHELKCVPRAKTFTAFHNAELPGAFVSATSHYIRTKRLEMKYDWRASSFWPGADPSGSKLGDTYGLYARHKDRWMMSSKFPADLTKTDNVLQLANMVRAVFPTGVDLYTSDAGFDVSQDFSNQEALTSQLNLGQVLTGLKVLRTGGTFIAKQFTFFSEFSRALIAALKTVFAQVDLLKPATSRDANSEVYVCCTGLADEKTTSALIKQLEAAMRVAEARQLVPCALPLQELGLVAAPAGIDNGLLAAARQLTKQQMQALTTALTALARPEISSKKSGRAPGALNKQCKAWLQRYPIHPLALRDAL